jgi:hypothetical protein
VLLAHLLAQAKASLTYNRHICSSGNLRGSEPGHYSDGATSI